MVLPALERAGMEVMAANLARILSRRGHEVGFTCIQQIGPLGEELIREGARVSLVAAPGLRPNLIPRELAAWFRSIRPDVVHIHGGVWLKGVAGARQARVPAVVGTLHGVNPVESWLSRRMLAAAARRMHAVVAVSDSLRDYLTDVLHVPQHRTSVVGNGIVTKHFRPQAPSPEFRRQCGIPERRRIIGCVARLDPVKNPLLLLEAFARLHAADPELYLLLVGDGPLRNVVEQHVAELGLQESVKITGVVEDTAPFYRAMAVFALPSLIEGTSMSLLEAMASGTPVVATAVGGTPALLGGGRFGTLVVPSNATALADAIAAVLADHSMREERSARARAMVEQSFSDEAMTDRYESIYRDPQRVAQDLVVEVCAE